MAAQNTAIRCRQADAPEAGYGLPGRQGAAHGMAEPRRETIVREICGVPGGCIDQCLGCIVKANAIIQLSEGRKAR
jgi:hypothetical protein